MLQGVNFQSDAQGVMHTNPIIFLTGFLCGTPHALQEEKKLPLSALMWLFTNTDT